MKERIKGFFSIESLRWNMRIPLRLKCSSWCGDSVTSNGGSWCPLVVVGGGEEGVRVLGGRLKRNKSRILIREGTVLINS